MRAILEVDMDGFSDGYAGAELAFVLREAAAQVERFSRRGLDSDTWPFALRDAKGNRVGSLRIEEGEPTADEGDCRECGRYITRGDDGVWRVDSGDAYCINETDHEPELKSQPTADTVNEDYYWINERAGTYRCTAACGFQFDDGEPENHRCNYDRSRLAYTPPDPKPQPIADVNAEPSPLKTLRESAHDELVAAAQDVVSHLNHYVATHPLVTEAGVRVLRFRAALENVEALT